MLRGHFPRSTFRGLGWFLNLTFVSESFVQELNGTPRDTKGSSFVLNPSVLTEGLCPFTQTFVFQGTFWKKSGLRRVFCWIIYNSQMRKWINERELVAGPAPTCFSHELPKALHKSCSQSIVLRPSIHPSNERRVKPAQSGLCA